MRQPETRNFGQTEGKNVATNAQYVFDIAMGLMDELDEGSGKTDTADTKEYKQRTLLILNALRGELFSLSGSCKSAPAGKRPVCPLITDFEKAVELDDFICQSVMPYGLAAHLLVEENPAAASFFQQRYNELLRRYGDGVLSVSEDITDLYGGI